MFGAKYVDLAADTEGIEIDPRLHGESCPGQDAPLVVRFVVVEVHPITMDVLAEAMAGTVQHMIRITSPDQHGAGGPIHFPAAKLATAGRGILHRANRGVPGIGNGLEGSPDGIRDLA